MKGLKNVLQCVCCVLLIRSPMVSTESLTLLSQAVREMGDDLFSLRQEMLATNGQIYHEVKNAVLLLKLELFETFIPSFLNEKVKETLEDIFQERSIEDMVTDHVLKELEIQKRGFQFMKGGVRNIHKRQDGIEQRTERFERTFAKTIQNQEDKINNLRSLLENLEGQLHPRDERLANITLSLTSLQTETKHEASEHICANQDIDQECNRTAEDLKNITARIEDLECKTGKILHVLENMNHSFVIPDENCEKSVEIVQTTSRESLPARTMTSVPPTPTPVPPTNPSSPQTSEVKMSRLLIANGKNINSDFIQMDLNSLDSSKYPLNILKTRSIMYDRLHGRLFIGTYSPDRIISSRLNSSVIKVLRRATNAYGFTIDYALDTVFLTTQRPYTLSRMSTEGKDFSRVVYLDTPYSLAADCEKKLLYLTHGGVVRVVSYKGDKLQMIPTIKAKYALALNPAGDILFYGEGKTIKQFNLSNNNTKMISQRDDDIHTLQVYDNKLYVSVSNGDVGVVDLANNATYSVLFNVVSSSWAVPICLIP